VVAPRHSVIWSWVGQQSQHVSILTQELVYTRIQQFSVDFFLKEEVFKQQDDKFGINFIKSEPKICAPHAISSRANSMDARRRIINMVA
jgi:hypothetical protein